MILRVNESIAIKIAKYGTWFYIFSVIINCILMWDYLQFSSAGVFFIGFVAANTFMGVVLVYAIERVELMTI